MTFNLHCPAPRIEEIRWIADFIIVEYLGLSYQLVVSPDSSNFVLMADGKKLSLPDKFFANVTENWLDKETIPKDSVRKIKIVGGPLEGCGLNELPLLYGDGGFEMTSPTEAFLGIDVFGFCFFLLSRYEEVANPVCDFFSRYSSAVSMAVRNDFLEYPVVDHYIEILFAAIKILWPKCERLNRSGKIVVSCDIDEPYERWVKNWRWLTLGVIGSFLKKRSFSAVQRRILNYRKSLGGDYTNDECWSFDWYLSTCEAAGRSVMFYVFGRMTGVPLDGVYDLREPRIVELLKQIKSRGHAIGLHSSILSYRSKYRINNERANLQRACDSLGYCDQILFNRQHYLRFQVNTTPECLESAGIKFDSSGGYAERAGFRFGTSRPFNMWSFYKRRSLNLKQYPLILMDGTLVDLMGLGYGEEAYKYVDRLKKESLRFGGDFNLLWHNSDLRCLEAKELFRFSLSS